MGYPEKKGAFFSFFLDHVCFIGENGQVSQRKLEGNWLAHSAMSVGVRKLITDTSGVTARSGVSLAPVKIPSSAGFCMKNSMEISTLKIWNALTDAELRLCFRNMPERFAECVKVGGGRTSSSYTIYTI